MEQFYLKPLEAIRNLLVIGYGNELRSDDGVGPKVAATVEAWHSPSIHTIACHQLTPELAEPIASADAVIFVDATLERLASIQLKPIQPVNDPRVMTHVTDPRSLLCLARTIFGRCPQSWVLTIPIKNVGFGGELSDLATKGFEAAVAQIHALQSTAA